MVEPITIGRRTFIGNAALVPVGSNIPDGCLIGVLSTPPQATIYPGSSWLGLPPMYLPRRQVVEGYSEEQTFRPHLSAYALRYGYEFFRITLPPAFTFGILWTVFLLSHASLATRGSFCLCLCCLCSAYPLYLQPRLQSLDSSGC